MNDIIIIDYGLGNLKSIKNAFKYLDIPARITTNSEQLNDATHIILPGVGAFKDGMNGLREANFINPLTAAASEGKIILGICLGMQMLLTESHEFGIHKGLGLIKGTVKPFKPVQQDNNYRLKVPHVGWNNLIKLNSIHDSPFSNIVEKDQMYFVHSFFCDIKSKKHVLATTQYGLQEFHSIINKDNIYGCQFHPERSGKKGLNILKNFALTNKK